MKALAKDRSEQADRAVSVADLYNEAVRVTVTDLHELLGDDLRLPAGATTLAGVLGLYLGWVSWGAVVIGTFAAFLVGAVVGIAVMVIGEGGRKTKIPFGPFMFVGTAVGLLVAAPIVDWYVGNLGL